MKKILVRFRKVPLGKELHHFMDKFKLIDHSEEGINNYNQLVFSTTEDNDSVKKIIKSIMQDNNVIVSWQLAENDIE